MSFYTEAVGVSFFLLASATVASAQGATTAAGPQQAVSSGGGLEEVVVTAQRRAESAQDVPIAVAAFSGDDMIKFGLASSADLASVIPGLSINPTAARSPIFLRGVGNNGTSTSPSVLMFVDGVYQPFDNTGADYSNVESLEVAKGPQGTLFGRNATGGVIQVTTKNPFDWQGVDAQVGYANFDNYSAKVYGSAALSDRVAADVAGYYDNQEDGWGKNRFSGRDVYSAERYGVRSKWVVKFDDSFTATLTGDYAYRWGQMGLGISQADGRDFLFNAVTQQTYTLPSIYDVSLDREPYYRTSERGGALTLDKRWGDVKLLSISSYRRGEERLRIDFDGTEFPALHLSRDDDRRAFTQEVQLSGGDESFHWVGGLYYYYAKTSANGPRFDGFFVPFAFFAPSGTFRVSSDDETNAYAAYAQATKEVLPATNLTLGARYTIEKREIEGMTTGSTILSPGSAGTQDETFKEPSYRVSLDHKFTPDVLGYASWSRGFNAGFFNQIAVAGFNDTVNPVVKPEKIDAYEIGLKSEWLDGHLRMNAAVFQYEYSNLQQQIYQFGSIFSLNAAEARIKGVDVEIVASPMPDLTVSLSANYLDPKYLSYPLAVDYDFLPSGEFAAVGSRDAQGKQLVQAPEYGVQASVTYALRTKIGTFDTTGTLNYQSRMYADAQNELEIPERTLLGLTEQWTSSDGSTYVSVWGKNLTDEEYDVSLSLLTPVGPIGNPGAPRTYGVTVGRKF